MTPSAVCVIDVSIVSHLHGQLIHDSLNGLAASLLTNPGCTVRVWLTLNLPETELSDTVANVEWPFELRLIHNPAPLGFGANHNQAFTRAQLIGRGQWFVVMNPDVFWRTDAHIFWASLAFDAWSDEVGLVCPQQIDAQGQPQDFARKLMTPWGQGGRVLRRLLRKNPIGVAASLEIADWVNGACMVWRSEAFARLGGFDERYFMYCEDADICLRLQLAGWRMVSASVTVVHDARRNTGKSLRHLFWHLRSMWRFWRSATFWRYVTRRRMK